VARDAGIKAETKLIEATPPGARIASMIAAEAKAWPADMIVIGTHGRRGVDHLLMGSVAEGVVRISPVPVLLIRGR
jgi:nucleotide-binding universal stress UspA family protein